MDVADPLLQKHFPRNMNREKISVSSPPRKKRAATGAISTMNVVDLTNREILVTVQKWSENESRTLEDFIEHYEDHWIKLILLGATAELSARNVWPVLKINGDNNPSPDSRKVEISTASARLGDLQIASAIKSEAPYRWSDNQQPTAGFSDINENYSFIMKENQEKKPISDGVVSGNNNVIPGGVIVNNLQFIPEYDLDGGSHSTTRKPSSAYNLQRCKSANPFKSMTQRVSESFLGKIVPTALFPSKKRNKKKSARQLESSIPKELPKGILKTEENGKLVINTRRQILATRESDNLYEYDSNDDLDFISDIKSPTPCKVQFNDDKADIVEEMKLKKKSNSKSLRRRISTSVHNLFSK